LSGKERPFSEIHRARVARFESLYNSVTEEIETFRDRVPNALPPDDRQWLTTRIAGFRERYEAWFPQEIEYLEKLYSQNWNTFTVCRHASLHISYDLPVVIAATLRGGTEVERLLRADHYEEIYVNLERTFINAIHKPWDKPWLIEVLQWRPLEVEGLFLTWLLALRRHAWFRAKGLVRSTEDDWASLETHLHKEVQETLELALKNLTWWGKLFALSAPRPIPGWVGAELIAALVSGVAFLLSSWLALALGFQIGLPFLMNFVFKKIAVIQLNKMLNSFLPRSIDSPNL